MLLLISLFSFITITTLVLYIGSNREATNPEDRLRRHQSRTLLDLQQQQTRALFTYADSEAATTGRALLQAALKRASVWVSARLSTSYVSGLERQLLMAGLRNKIQPAQFVVIRVGTALVFPFLPFVLLGSRAPLPMLASAAALGWVLPGFWLKQQVTTRQKLIQKALPDTIDLLTVSVEAGLGFDAAAARVAEKAVGPIGEEFRHYLRLVRMGTPRREAMRELGDRAGVGDLHTFTTGLIQADQLGVSMSKVLRVQSEEMRRKRRQRAEEKAMKAPIKMLFPLVFCIFPSIFIVLLGPAGIRIAAMFMQLRRP